jgi:phosphatidylserine/phosphatidylglycerophosphate/cardiolipin synthase-like enzyme/uncharacterized membrane protein YdjX (TVP38/TMEM64 family)
MPHEKGVTASLSALPSESPDPERSLLREGETVWRRARAGRAALLLDGAGYYGALRDALMNARHAIFIVGWDIDSRTRIVGDPGSAADGAPESLRELLPYLASRRSTLDIYILPWDYSFLFLPERELLPTVVLGWNTPERVHLCLDGTAPVVSSHHQKLVVIDDSLAFCGGLDLTIRRWDTPDHSVDCPARVDPAGEPYGPYHDLQMMVDGDAAEALAELARARWTAAAQEPPAAMGGRVDLWPESVAPDFRDVTVGIARTVPESLEGPGVYEIERLYLEAIARAERTIYIENQYLNCDAIAKALARQAEQAPELEIVIVSNQESGGWLEERTMGVGRRSFISLLQQSSGADRIRTMRSLAADGKTTQEVHIHAKLLIVDDRLLHVGSANLNHRSMGLDTECDLAIEAANSDERRRILELRDTLIGHHLGVSREALQQRIARHGSIIAAIDAAGAMEPIDPNYPPAILDKDFEIGLAEAADPRRPPFHAALSGALAIRPAKPDRKGLPIGLIVAVLVTIALPLLWYFTPVAEYADVETLEPYFRQIDNSGWALIAIPLIFIVASFAFFPITILIALSGMTLGPVTGFLSAAGGCLGSAALAFGAGMMMGENGIRRIMGQRLNRMSRNAASNGVLSIAVLRLLPIAPFTAINLVAGASHIRFGDYMIGTALGMLPGILLMSALGDRLREVWRNPSVENIVMLGLLAAAWLAAAFGLQYLIKKHRRSG